MQQINLYSPIFRREEKKFSSVAMAQSAGAVLAGVVLLYAYLTWQLWSLKQEAARADDTQAAVARRLDDAMRKFGGKNAGLSLGERVAALEREVESRRQLEQLLQRGVFSNTTGYSAYFTAFARQHVSGLWLTGFDITGAGEQMTLSGRTSAPELVPQYLRRLANEQPLKGTEFRVFRMTRPEAEKDKPRPAFVEFTVRTSEKTDGAAPITTAKTASAEARP